VSVDPHLTAALGEALGRDVAITNRESVGGGCISAAAIVETTAGRFFTKSNDTPGLFAAEAAGLRALRDSGTSLHVPEVILAREPGSGPGMLVTTVVEAGRPGRDFDRRVGIGLAELHRCTANRFGFEGDNHCGATSQPNPWTDGWVAFYRDHRIGHQVRLATKAGLLDRQDRSRCEALQDKLQDLLGSDEGPALIHGDLWSGNLLCAADGTPALIDPAAYFGHREAELGMMTLFGGFSRAVYDAYETEWPIRGGWRERNPLYQLYHLLNHANLFGGGYTQQAMAIVRRFVG